jgi:hypothetical protein
MLTPANVRRLKRAAVFFLIATETVQRFGEHNVESPVQRVAHQRSTHGNRVFRLILRCSVWPSNEVRDVVLDLALLRNLIVHNSRQDWSQDGVMPAAYAAQFRGADVLSARR